MPMFIILWLLWNLFCLVNNPDDSRLDDIDRGKVSASDLKLVVLRMFFCCEMFDDWPDDSGIAYDACPEDRGTVYVSGTKYMGGGMASRSWIDGPCSAR